MPNKSTTKIRQAATKKLGSRYFPVDYVSEFQKYWAYLNKFYDEAFQPIEKKTFSLEQRKLEAFKRFDKVEDAVNVYVSDLRQFDNIEQTAIDSWSQQHPRSILMDHLMFNHQNVLTKFVSAFSSASRCNPEVAKGLDRYIKTPGLTKPCLIYLDYSQYRILYSSIKKGWDVSEEYPLFDAVLNRHGLQSAGKIVFAYSRPVGKGTASTTDAWKELKNHGQLPELEKAANVRSKSRVSDDIIQYVYISRNAAMHGGLDHLNPIDNELAHTALQVVRDLIEAIVL